MASSIKGITVEINGNTTGLTEALKNVDKQINKSQKELKQVNQALKFDPKNTELLAQKQQLLGDAIRETSEKLKTLKKAKEDAEKSGLNNQDAGYRELQREISKTTQELKGLETQQKKVNGIKFTNLGEDFTKFGKSCTELSEKLRGVSTIGASVVASLTAITLSASANADEINTMAKKYNLSTKEIQQFQMASELIDVDLGTITKSFNKLTQAMANGTKSTTEAFDKLGVSTKNADGSLRSSNDVFYETIGALAEVQDETEQDALAFKIFGKSASELGPLINGGTEQLKELNKYMEENGLILSQESLDGLNATQDAMDRLKIVFEGVKNTIASDFAPIVETVVTKVSEIVLQFKDKWEQLSPTFKKIIPIIASVVASLSPVLAIIGKLTGAEGIGGLLTALGSEGGLAGALTNLLNPITLIASAFALLWAGSEDFRNGIMSLVETLVNNLQPIFELIITRVQELVTKIKDFLQPVIEKVGEVIATYVIPVIQNIIEALRPIVEIILNTIFDNISFIIDALGTLWEVLDNIGIIDAFGKAFKIVGDIITSVIEIIKKAVEWISKLIGKIRDFFASGFEKIGDFFGGIFGGSNSANFNLIATGPSTAQLSNLLGNGILKTKKYMTSNLTINIENGNNITDSTVRGWAKLINDELGSDLG